MKKIKHITQIILILAMAIIASCTTPTSPTLSSNVTIPNPASIYCEQQGGRLDVIDTALGQRTDCVLTDGTRCDEWEYYRGNCPTANAECEPCSQLAPIPTNFCPYGKILPGEEDECGCRGAPQCVRENGTPRVCTQEAKLCPDGTAVGRTGPNCEFAPCPTANCTCPQGYVQEGSTCNPECYYFEPRCMMPAINCQAAIEEESTQCIDPRPEICTLQYDPVCGYSEQQVQCIRAPCPPIVTGKTYGNSCGACADEKVVYWTKGECSS